MSIENGENKLEGNTTTPETHNKETVVHIKEGDRVIIETESPEEKADAIDDIKDQYMALQETPVGDQVDSIKFNNKKIEEYNPNPEIAYNSAPAKRGFMSNVRRWGFTALASLGMLSATATEGGKNEPGKGKEPNYAAARKIEKLGKEYDSYTKVKKGDTTFAYKMSDGKQGELEMAKPSAVKGGAAYEKKMISLLQNGTSPEELAKKGYISSDRISEYKKYYVAPESDIVYVESEQPKEMKSQFAAWAEEGEELYTPNKHIAAEIFYKSRDSKDIEVGGGLNTSQEDVVIKLRNDFGFTGEEILVKAGDLQYLTAGTNHFQGNAYDVLKKQIDSGATVYTPVK